MSTGAFQKAGGASAKASPAQAIPRAGGLQQTCIRPHAIGLSATCKDTEHLPQPPTAPAAARSPRLLLEFWIARDRQRASAGAQSTSLPPGGTAGGSAAVSAASPDVPTAPSITWLNTQCFCWRCAGASVSQRISRRFPTAFGGLCLSPCRPGCYWGCGLPARQPQLVRRWRPMSRRR